MYKFIFILICNYKKIIQKKKITSIQLSSKD